MGPLLGTCSSCEGEEEEEKLKGKREHKKRKALIDFWENLMSMLLSHTVVFIYMLYLFTTQYKRSINYMGTQ